MWVSFVFRVSSMASEISFPLTLWVTVGNFVDVNHVFWIKNPAPVCKTTEQKMIETKTENLQIFKLYSTRRKRFSKNNPQPIFT